MALKLKNDDISPSPSCSSYDSTLDEEASKTPWKSILLCGFFMVCTGCQFGLFFASIWPYMQILDPLSTESFLGWIVASYSFGQILAAPVVGYISNRLKSIRIPVIVCIFLQMTGNVIYASAQLFDNDRRYAILAARFVNGIGATNIGLLKTFCSSASTIQDRSRSIAIGTGGLAIGLALGPSIQMLFVPIAYPGWEIFGSFKLSMYTAPAIFACFVNFVGIFVMAYVFEEKYAGLANDKIKKDEEKVYIPPYDRLGLLACYLARFTQMFVFTNIETLMGPYVMTIFALTKSQTVSAISTAHIAFSIVEFLMYAAFIFLKMDRFLNLRFTCAIGYIGLGIYYLATFNWPFYPGHLKTFTENEYGQFLSGNITQEPVGCNVDTLPWCYDVKPINIWLYFISYVLLMATAFSAINITLNTIFSHVIGPRRQATHQGILQMVGSVGRLIGPLLISYLYALFGPPIAWTIQIGLVIVTVIVWAIVYRRLIPLEVTIKSPPSLDIIQSKNDLKKTHL